MVFYSAPQSFLVVVGGGNSGAQAVLSAPTLRNTSDGLRTRLCLYPAVSVDCHSACTFLFCPTLIG